ncbi:MAG: ribonuclease HII [Thermodesulfobacteriota bacterium]
MNLFIDQTDTASPDTFQFERILQARGFSLVAGVDEVGRGPLAGPVVAACVILPPRCDHLPFVDSKALTAKRRRDLVRLLDDIHASVGIGEVSPARIDKINILQASLLAMKRAVEDLCEQGTEPDFLLVDGRFNVPLGTSQQPLIKGDARSASIGAASICAKVHRDELMKRFHEKYPLYNLGQNKGYPTREHRQALKDHGPTPIHRFSFKGVKPDD